MESVLSYLSSHYPLIGVLIIGIVIGGIIYNYHGLFQSVRKKVFEHSAKIDSISVWIMKKDKTMIEILAGVHSPVRLKQPGIALLEISGGKKCIDENINFFISKLKKLKPKTPYDVQQQSNDLIMSNTNLPLFNPIKNFLYFNPDTIEVSGEKVETSMFAVVYIMSIYLRDIYLEKNPEILPQNNPVQN